MLRIPGRRPQIPRLSPPLRRPSPCRCRLYHCLYHHRLRPYHRSDTKMMIAPPLASSRSIAQSQSHRRPDMPCFEPGWRVVPRIHSFLYSVCSFVCCRERHVCCVYVCCVCLPRITFAFPSPGLHFHPALDLHPSRGRDARAGASNRCALRNLLYCARHAPRLLSFLPVLLSSYA